MLMLGAWFGNQKKPNFRVFLKPLAEQMNRLRGGFQAVNHQGNPQQISFHLLTTTADNPAKEDIGAYQSTVCGICHQVPEFVANVNGHATVPTFPWKQQPATLRTRETIINDAQVAVQTGAPSRGIKGPPPLLRFEALDIVQGIDYLHNFCLRVMALLLNLWFSEAHRLKNFSHRNQVDEFDSRMVDTRPPEFISRPPQPFSKIKHWKAAEYRNFLLYYGPIVLKGIIGEEQLEHFMLFSTGTGIFLSHSITPEMRHLGQSMLNGFVEKFAGLYTARFMSKTVHSLVHIEMCILKTGPLWTTSCFPFESIYHFLVQLINGTQYVLNQVRNHSLSISERRRKK
jgi:hypothetical protein